MLFRSVTKIVYNRCYGGYGLSEEAMKRYAEIKGKGWKFRPNSDYEICAVMSPHGRMFSSHSLGDDNRADPILVQVVEELGDRANTRFSKLRIRELPAGTKYRIEEYDGIESVVTIEEYDWSVA